MWFVLELAALSFVVMWVALLIFAIWAVRKRS